MLPGPIFVVEAVTSVRRARYFVVRVLYAAALLVGMCAIYSNLMRGASRTPSIHDVAELSRAFFIGFATLQLLMVIGIGPGLAAGTIAQERERRTIEYLFTTTLSDSEIVLGKLSARLLMLFYLVLAGLPILSLSMLLGGISPGRLALAFTATLSTMVLVTSISTAISVWTPRAREAITRSYVLLLAVSLLPMISPLRGLLPLLPGWLEAALSAVTDAALLFNPFSLLLDQTPTDPLGWLGVLLAARTLVVGHMVTSGLALAIATWGVRRVHLKESGAPKRRGPVLPRLMRPGLGHFPMLWKELFAERAVPRLGIFGRIVVLLIVAGVLAPTIVTFVTSLNSLYSTQHFAEYATIMGVIVGCGGLLLVAARAASLVASEKERDTWTTLLSTPLEPAEIVFAKVVGNLYAARAVGLLLLVIWALAMYAYPPFIASALGTTFVLLLLATCVSLVGLLFSMKSSSSQRAMGSTLGLVVFFGGGYLFCCVPMMIHSGSGEVVMMAPCMPFLVAVPGVLSFERHMNGEAMAAFLLGIFGYFCLTLLLASIAVSSFEEISGRSSGVWKMNSGRRRME